MKLTKIMILAIFLLALVTVGVASAADENMTELQTDESIESSSDILAQEYPVQDTLSDETEPGEISCVFPDTIYAWEYFTVNITVPDGAGGELTYYYNDELDDDDSYYLSGGDNLCMFIFSKPGENKLTLDFVSYDTGICKDSYREFIYDVTEYGCEVSSEKLVYGNSATVDVYLPMNGGKGTIYINGAKMLDFDIADDYTNDYNVFIPKVNTSQINVTVDYNGYKDIKDKVYNKILEVEPKIIAPSEVIFNQIQPIVVGYEEGKKVNVLILDGDSEGSYIVVSNETMTISNGKAIYNLPALEFNKPYTVKILVDNIFYTEYMLKIVPNLNIPKSLSNKKNYTSTFEFPIEYANMRITVEFHDALIFEGKLSADAKVNVTVCPKDLSEDDYISISVEDNETGDVYYYKKGGILVRENDPSAVEIQVVREGEATIRGDFIEFDVRGVKTNEREVNVLINGTPVKVTRLWFHQFGISTNDMEPGIYNITIIYPGDGYFEPKSKEFVAEIASFRVDFPENILLYDTYVPVYVLFTEDASGTLTVSIDGKQVKKFDVATEYGKYDDGSISHCFEVFIQDYVLPLGNHTVNINYKGNKGSFDAEKIINLCYSIYFKEHGDFEYGYANDVTVYVPDDAKGPFNITVNGKPFTKFTRDEGEICVDISEFFGEIVVGVGYGGDAKFYPINVNKTFNIKSVYRANIDKVRYKDDEFSFISLRLPGDAKGNLVVEVDGVTYAKGSFEDGEAEVSLSELALGSYSIKAYYDGDDYEVEVLEKQMTVEPAILVSDSHINYGESVDFYIDLPDGANGTLYVYSDVGSKSQKMVNGSAKVTLSGLPVSSFSNVVDASFVYDDGSEISQTFLISVRPNIVSENMTVFGKNTVSFNANKDFEGYFLVCVDDEKDYGAAISNGNATVSLSDLTAGEHTLLFKFITEEGLFYLWEVVVNVSKAANPKLVPTALSVYYTNYYIVKAIGADGLPLKNAKIYFTIGKNTFKRYTDENGQAILKMAYKPGKYAVVAQYSKKVKTTNNVKVVGVATLYKVNVKKSAKKLVLVASLKKGKKAIKNAKVYFTFNGKTFKTTTSKKGYAIVTVKKADLNRLKVGKTVAYQVIYGKNVVKYTAKVRR